MRWTATLVMLAVLAGGCWVLGTRVVSADEPCACSSLSPPDGYYVTAISPVWTGGRPFLAATSMVTISAASLMPFDVLERLAESLERDRSRITLEEALSDRFLRVRLSLVASAGKISASALSFFLETSAGKQILPAHSIALPASGSSLTVYLLVEKDQVLGAKPSWVRVHVVGSQGQGYFQVRG